MNEEEKRAHRCCFTGHRPEKLYADERAISAALEQAIDAAIADGFTTFISGMARGVDIWAAEIVLCRRQHNPALRLICACPHPAFETRWPTEWATRYCRILSEADLVRTICPSFSMTAYQLRNEWMVDHSARVIAVYNGEPGGTRNTIEYARRYSVDIRTIQNELPGHPTKPL